MKTKRTIVMAVVLLLSLSFVSFAGPLDDALKGMKFPADIRGIASKATGPDEKTTIAGLKEALSIGTGNAISSVSKLDGYFKNQMIKILMPEKIQTMTNILGKIGYQRQVDDFVLSMNRAAEKAAPWAKKYFIGAIKQMSFDDARKILTGGNTAATDFFKSKTWASLFDEFKPIVSRSMNEVGVTKSYKDMTGKYLSAVPMAGLESLDLDQYVTNKALDGLFYMVGQEENKIRTDPAARITDLLKKTFGK